MKGNVVHIPVTTYFKPHTYTSKPSGAPSYQSPQTTASFKPNEGKWITIPSSFYAGFVSGSYKGIGIYINSTNQNYYAKFDATAKDDRLPAPKDPDPVPGLYTIQEGDTFWSIALKDGKEGISVEDLIAANPDVDTSKLKVGQTIKFGLVQNSYTPKPETPKKDQSEYKYPLSSGVFKLGSTDKIAIMHIQNALNVVKYKCGTADGIYGPRTEDALKRFQMVYLPYDIDGIYGPNTKSKLQEVLESQRY